MDKLLGIMNYTLLLAKQPGDQPLTKSK